MSKKVKKKVKKEPTADEVVYEKDRKFIKSLGPEIEEKFKNINGKTNPVAVPKKLYPDRTHRRNRALISWKTVKKNKLTISQLNTFKNGICVEFINDDILNDISELDETYKELKNRIGSDENVSSIITFRVEDGDPGATVARESFKKFESLESGIELKKIERVSKKIHVDAGYARFPGQKNEFWKGNAYYDISGGKQKKDSIKSHTSEDKLNLFNSANEYANDVVCNDLYITLFYFFIHCHDIDQKLNDKLEDFTNIKQECEDYLRTRDYDENNLYEYCITNPCLTYNKGILTDPIEVKKISVDDFKEQNTKKPEHIALCHNESADKQIIKFDKINGCIVSAARPTNMFWMYHTSNMLQQNHILEEYITLEAERVNRRHKIFEKNKE